MTLYSTFPDAEAIAGKALRDADITGLSTRVYSSLPKEPTYPLAIVKRIGGVPAERHQLDKASLQIEVWGGPKADIHDISQDARVVLHELEGTTVSDPNAFVAAVEDTLGLAWLPDPVTNRDRYIFGVTLYLHP